MEGVGLLARDRGQIDDVMAVGILDKLAIKLGPAVRLDLPFQGTLNVEIGPWPEFQGDQILGAGTHPLFDVISGDDEILAIVGDAAHDDVDMRMLGVPVIDGDPIKLGAEVFFHLPDQIAGKALEVGEVGGILRRDDEAEMMSVVFAAFGERLGIGILGFGTEQPGLFSVPGDALAAEITEMGGKRRGMGAMADHPGLDGDQTGAAGQQAIGADAGDTAVAKMRGVPLGDHAVVGDAAAGPLGGGQCLGDEWLGPLALGRADAAGPNLEVIVPRHAQASQCAEFPVLTMV
ncbi:hypothetical protein GALL_244220 [mine drainage metagenome]|uniref:Uncharacterized protein n=1 Tax=mine drainage metagenome TaxID=410659 RepID=A0A1J5RBX2_9ZZZZ